MNARLGLIFSVFAAISAPMASAAEPVYPGEDWATAMPEKHGYDSAKLKEIDGYAFAPDGTTDALLIVAGGEIIYERYARDYTAKMRHYGWSMTKSVSMAIFGIAESEGKIRRDDPVSKWVPEAKSKAWEGVRLEHLLSMSTGVDWRENYESSPFDSHVVTALYRTAKSFDFGLYRASIDKRVASPGERFNYSSGDTNLLMRALKAALGRAYDDYPWDRLFTPIGMKSAVFERDGSGTFIGSSYLEATPRDFARFGYLFLRGGKWKGKTIVPAEWVKLAHTPSPGMEHARDDHRPKGLPYAYSWWLNAAEPKAGIVKPYPVFPDDIFFASGHDGQETIVLPSWDMVIVRLGNDRFGRRIDFERVGSMIKAARRAGGAR